MKRPLSTTLISDVLFCCALLFLPYDIYYIRKYSEPIQTSHVNRISENKAKNKSQALPQQHSLIPDKNEWNCALYKSFNKYKLSVEAKLIVVFE